MKITYLEKALVVMFRAHSGQVDKGGDPYYKLMEARVILREAV